MWTADQPKIKQDGILERHNMSNKKYTSLKEWRKDYKIFKQNPDDKDLMISIATKMENSSKKLREEITDFIECDAMLTKPVSVLYQIHKRNSNTIPVIRSEEDPWFSC